MCNSSSVLSQSPTIPSPGDLLTQSLCIQKPLEIPLPWSSFPRNPLTSSTSCRGGPQPLVTIYHHSQSVFTAFLRAFKPPQRVSSEGPKFLCWKNTVTISFSFFNLKKQSCLAYAIASSTDFLQSHSLLITLATPLKTFSWGKDIRTALRINRANM